MKTDLQGILLLTKFSLEFVSIQPQPVDQQGPREPPREGLNMEENNLTITGPPASRTVIDNLKKLLLQRQHSRESDTEVKLHNTEVNRFRLT